MTALQRRVEEALARDEVRLAFDGGHYMRGVVDLGRGESVVVTVDRAGEALAWYRRANGDAGRMLAAWMLPPWLAQSIAGGFP